MLTQRVRRLNAIALAVALTYGLLALEFVGSRTVVSGPVDFIFVYVTSAGFYQLIVEVIFKTVESSSKLMRLYWGHLHVAGLWSYVYTVEGDASGTVYFGVWRFNQDLHRTSVVGFGLTALFKVRSHVRSVTNMVENDHVCEVVNIRSDSVDAASEYYSRTTMFFEQSPDRFLAHPSRMRGKTFVYGGPLTGRVCNNSFLRHETARTEQDVIDILHANMQTHGEIHPDGWPGAEV